MASYSGAQTEKTLDRHWQAFGAGDVEAIMADYAGDAVFAVRKDFCERVSSRQELA